MLSDSESEGDQVHQLTINQHFAKAYAYKKEREELTKLKEKYGSDAGEDDGDDDDETDSEEDESEDEDGEELTPAVDAAILRTLARIKKKDPDIYDAQKGIFEEEQKKTRTKAFTTRAQGDKTKPLLMRQHLLNSTLHAGSRSPSPEPEPELLPTHVQEQEALRHETIDAFRHAVPDAAEEDGDDDGLLVPREKTQDEREREEEEYREFLAREVGEDIGGLVTLDGDAAAGASEDGEEDGAVKKEEEEEEEGPEESGKKRKKKKKNKAVEKKKESDHEFLMNYILNRGWIDKSARHIPTYHEVTASKGRTGSSSKADDGVHGSENEGADADAGRGAADGGLDDEEFEDVADTFESSYNFRFEEPDAALIPAHPRTIDALVRRPDTSRKDARERKRERKEAKLLKKREEVRRMKALKMKEIRARLERIGKEGGRDVDVDADAFAELDLDAEWDPEAHDRQMAGIYDDDGDGDGAPDDAAAEKPTWDDDIDITDIVPASKSKSNDSSSNNKKKKKKKNAKKDEAQVDDGGDGVDVNDMDADVEAPVPAREDVDEEEEWDGTEEMRKRKLDEYLDEVYGMEFNDMVGDTPTRFKYTPVLPQHYGLTASEILLATDAELNAYVGVKRYAPYRRAAGAWDHGRGERLRELKDKLRARAMAGADDDDSAQHVQEGERPAKKRKGKKERQRAKLGGGEGDAPEAAVEGAEGPSQKKRRRQKKSIVHE